MYGVFILCVHACELAFVVNGGKDKERRDAGQIGLIAASRAAWFRC